MNQELQNSVNAELRNDSSVEAERVVVTVCHGTVRLSGEVRSVLVRLAANRAAMRVRGVRAVADEMTVLDPGNADVDVAETARRMLTWSSDVPAESVTAEVSNHVITLSGTVASQHQRDAATRAVMNLRGVTAVSNQIRLQPA
jgi:osmotically-inducible protein OsmY